MAKATGGGADHAVHSVHPPRRRPRLKFIPLKISAKGIESSFVNARNAAGMPWVHFHDLRRSTATLMLASGAPMNVISKLLGHSSTRVTEARYAHLQLDAVRAGLDAAFAPDTKTPPQAA